MPDTDPEIAAINAVNEALSRLEDPDARARVLRWANERFFARHIGRPASTALPPVLAAGTEQATGREMPGVAKILDNGEFKLTLRDPKAKNTSDAAIRLALITIRAYTQLTGETSVSSRKVVVPTLKFWRAYDGNTRTDLARHRGLVRSGDALSLDVHATEEADRYIQDALNKEIVGTWKTVGKTRKKASGMKEKTDGSTDQG